MRQELRDEILKVSDMLAETGASDELVSLLVDMAQSAEGCQIGEARYSGPLPFVGGPLDNQRGYGVAEFVEAIDPHEHPVVPPGGFNPGTPTSHTYSRHTYSKQKFICPVYVDTRLSPDEATAAVNQLLRRIPARDSQPRAAGKTTRQIRTLLAMIRSRVIEEADVWYICLSGSHASYCSQLLMDEFPLGPSEPQPHSFRVYGRRFRFVTAGDTIPPNVYAIEDHAVMEGRSPVRRDSGRSRYFL